jgi:sodium pump decarboxylase gamma subunit
MIQQGLTLMLAGMGTVLLFLSIMVVVMNGTAWFFKKYAHLFPEEQHEESHLKRLTPDDSEEIAVVVAAIEAFRS